MEVKCLGGGHLMTRKKCQVHQRELRTRIGNHVPLFVLRLLSISCSIVNSRLLKIITFVIYSYRRYTIVYAIVIYSCVCVQLCENLAV